jgi:hypothetical protein
MTKAQIKTIDAIKATGGTLTLKGSIGATHKSINVNGATIYGSTLGTLVDKGILFHAYTTRKDGSYINTWTIE